MASAGGYPSWQAMVSVRTFIVPPGPCPTPADTPGTSPAATTSQVTASIHDFAGSLPLPAHTGVSPLTSPSDPSRDFADPLGAPVAADRCP